jgi:type VI secretion system protein VasD
MSQRRTSLRVLVAVSIVLLAACKLIPFKKPPAAPPPAPPPPTVVVKPPPIPINLTFQASATVNPNDADRPSPVVVRVYQLKSDVAFKAASYEKLYEDDKGVIGPDLIEVHVMTLRPGAQSTVSIPFSQEIRFVGIAAFLRRYDGKQWRISIPAPLKGDGIISVDQSGVIFAAK